MRTAAVAVILPTRDRAWCLPRAIDSVLSQTFDDLELIVVDDGSTDETAEVLHEYRHCVTTVTQEPTGVYPARNRGLAHSNAELVAFIDSDDAWLPHRLESQLPLLERPEVGLVFGNARINGSSTTTFDVTPPARGRCAGHLVWGNFVPTVTVLARTRALGRFAETARLSADYLAWYRVARRHELDYVADVVADYTVHPGGISFDLTNALETRIELFRSELSATTDESERVRLRRLLFNLSMHLALASARGRRGNLRLAQRTAALAGGLRAAAWLPAFAAHHGMARARRVLQQDQAANA